MLLRAASAHSPRRRFAIAVLVASASQLASCTDGVRPPAPATAVVNITVSMSGHGGGRQVYDRADRLLVRFVAGEDVRTEQELPFAPSGADTIVRLEVPLREPAEEMSAELELRVGAHALFRSTTTTTLSADSATSVDFALEPVVASVTCGTGAVQLSAYGQTVQLTGAALFVTGDTVRDVPVTWTALATTAVSVSAEGVVTALQDGDATATCAASTLNATRAVRVFAVASSVRVAPSSATLVAGATLPLVATLFDARSNPITTSRPLTWSTANTGVATVSPAGVVTGVSAGSTRIDATSGNAAGSALLSVIVPPIALTTASTSITGSSATLVGSVNPRGSSTRAWFEWGTDAALTASSATAAQTVGGGTSEVDVTQALTGLSSNTAYYFRTVASSAAGVARGAVLSFRTPPAPAATTIGLDTGEAYTVAGLVTPNGSATAAWFEYGTSSSLAGSAKSAQQSIGSGSSAVRVVQLLSGLQQSTTYFVRVAASNIGGTTFGDVASFRTGSAPTVGALTTSVPPNSCQTVVASTSANPNGLPTLGWIEYGASADLTSFNATAFRPLGNGTTPVSFAAALFGSPTIYFRAAAGNQYGTVRSAIQSIGVVTCP